MTVAHQRNLIISGHRSSNDKVGLESEAKALAGLAGLKLPSLAIEGSAAGFKSASTASSPRQARSAARTSSVKGGTGGVEGSVKGGPVTAGGAIGKDSAKVEVKVGDGPVELKTGSRPRPVSHHAVSCARDQDRRRRRSHPRAGEAR